MRVAYALVRTSLGAAEVRYRRQYDVKVHKRTFNVGDWVRFFNSQKLVGKQDKRRRNYSKVRSL